MRKFTLMAAMVLLIGLAGFAQVFEKGSQAINVGIGFGNTNYFGGSYSGFLPSVSGSYEYGIVEIPMGSQLNGVISVGGYMGLSASKYGDWGGDHYNVTNFIIAARGNYHFIFHEKFDPYAGIWVGFDIESWNWKGSGNDPDYNSADSHPNGGAYVGARWYFNDNIAAYAELGYLISVLNIGVTFKIK